MTVNIILYNLMKSSDCYSLTTMKSIEDMYEYLKSIEVNGL